MLKELKKDSQYLYINYELVKKYANKIKLMIDNENIYEGKISSDLVFELKKFIFIKNDIKITYNQM